MSRKPLILNNVQHRENPLGFNYTQLFGVHPKYTHKKESVKKNM